MTESFTTPGTQGHARSTWRNETHLRGVLLALMTRRPDITREALEDMYLTKVMQLAKLKTLPPLIEEALRYKFDNDFANLHKSKLAKDRRFYRTRLTEEEVAAEAERVRNIILLDLVEPNGKKLRDCTGAECRAFGGWRIKIADRIGDRGVVGKKLSEQDLRNIRDGVVTPSSPAKRGRTKRNGH
jgi:hypothetical protein